MPSISYVLNIPLATDKASVSQGNLLTNTTGVNAWTAVDHYEFVDSNAGLHKKITLPVQTVAPTITAGNIALYNFLSPTTANNQLYFTDNAGAKRPLTILKNTSPGFWTILPCNILMGWGRGIAASSGNNTISWASLGMPTFTGIQVATVSSNDTLPAAVQMYNYNNTNLFVNATQASSNFTFVVFATVNSSVL